MTATMTPTTHLWEIEHSYYCYDGNYYSNECFLEYRGWKQFLAEEGESDFDMNLVVRFDWVVAGAEDGGTPNTLKIYYVGQRKGLFRAVHVTHMKKTDEPDVVRWLAARFEHLKALWAPLS